MTEQTTLSLAEAIDAVAGTAATNAPQSQQKEGQVPPAEGELVSGNETPDNEGQPPELKGSDQASDQPNLADDGTGEPMPEDEEKAPDPGEGYVTLDDGPINYEDAAALVVKDKDGNELNVSDLLGERYMQSQYTADMQELTGLRKEMETVGRLTDDFQNVALNELAGLVTHYNQYWQQLPTEAKQILKQLAEVHDAAREQQAGWRDQYNKRMQESRLQEVRYGIKRLRGYIPNWNRGVYDALKEHYQETYGTDPNLINDIVDPGIMAGLYQGMQQSHARKRLRKRVKAGSEPENSAPRGGDQQPARAQRKMPERFGTINDAVDFLNQE